MRRETEHRDATKWFSHRILVIASVLGGLIAGLVWDTGSLQAQGPLRRLGDRIRARIEPLPQPPVSPNRPVTPASDARPVAPYNTRATAPQQNGAGRTGLTPVQPRRPQPTPLTSTAVAPSSNGPTIGIEVTEYTAGFRGVQVVEFQAISRAASSGLRSGDVIVGVEGRPVASIEDVAVIIAAFESGQSVQLRVVPGDVLAAANEGRGRLSVRDLDVPLVARSTAAAANRELSANRDGGESNPEMSLQQARYEARNPTIDGAAQLGLELEDGRGRQGAFVTRVSPNSAGQLAKLQTGDRIVSINGRVIRDVAGFDRTLSAAKSGEPLRVQWVRGNQLREANVSLAGDDGLASSDGVAGAASAANPSTPDLMAEPTPERSGGSIMSGLGSAMGNFFGGQSMAKSGGLGDSILTKPEDTAAARESKLEVTRELPSQAEEMILPAPVADPLALGDDPLALGDDPLALGDEELAPPAIATEQSVERLRAEVERLRNQVRELKATGADQ